MASFGEALVSAFNTTYGTMSRAALQSEQAMYLRDQREGAERFRQEDADLRRQFGVEGAPAAPAAPQATPVQQAAGAPAQPPVAPQTPQAPAAPQTQGSAVATAQAAQPQPQTPREPPLTSEELNQASQGDAVAQAGAARIVAPQQTDARDVRGPAALANDVASFSGAQGRPLTRADWNGYYEARIRSAQANLPPDQAIRMISMLDGLRQRGFSQSISIATAAANAGDAQGATRALTAASNFLPDGFRDEFRVAANGQGIEMTRTPEEGGGAPSRTVIPLNQVERYSLTLMDPKWTLTHYLNVRQQDERERHARVSEGQRGEEIALRRDERTERRAFDARGGEAINLTRSIARMEGEYGDAVAAGNNERAEQLRTNLDTERGKLTDVLAQGVSTSAAAGMTRAETDAARTRIQARVAATRQQRVNTMEEVARDSLALRERALDDAMTKHDDKYDLALSRLSQQERIVAVREDNLRARVARDTARDDESRKRAQAMMDFTERRLRVLEGNADRRAQPRAEIPTATRTEIGKYEENRDASGGSAPTNPALGGVASEFYTDVALSNPRLRGGDVGRLTDELFRSPAAFGISPDFRMVRQNSTGSRLVLPDTLSESLREWKRQSESRASNGPPASQEGQNTSMRRGAVANAAAAPNTGTASESTMLSESARYGIPRAEYLRPNDPLNRWIFVNTRSGQPIPDREMARAAARFNMPVNQIRERIRQLQAATP